jgi:peptidoglycan/xylan/chitin deacetylase (PgdA/CDA1 family)
MLNSKESIKTFLKLSLQKLLGDRHLIYRLPADKRCVALTFDDGSNAKYTPMILETLRKNKVKATFFLVGGYVEAHPDIAKSILADGHAVGMHSYSHNNFALAGVAQQKEEILKTQKVFQDILGISSDLFRPPGGKLTLYQLFWCIKHSIRTILWTVDTKDAQFKGKILSPGYLDGIQFNSGDIVLLHDDNIHTVNFLQGLIDKIKQQGFEFVTIGDSK